jgi:glycosyltransferase involved in cell wall biosynthesis
MNPISGGPCQGVRNIMPELLANGISGEVLCLDNPNADFFKTDEFVTHVLGPSTGLWKYSSSLYPWLIKNLHKYDIVFVRGLWLYHSYAVAKAIRQLKKNNKQKIPIVYIYPHGMLDPWFQKNGKRRIKAVRNNIYWSIIEKNVVNEADGLLFTCESELELAQKTFCNYNPKISINVGYGIPEPPVYIEKFKAVFCEKSGWNGIDSYLLFLGRIDEKKGVDILIEAYKKLLNENINPPKLIIAGPGFESAYGKKIIKSISSNDILKNNIILTDMLVGDAKWGAFYNCDAFILPSHQENFGIAVVEALACSKHVLISNQVNIFDEIENEDAGIVCSDNFTGVYQMLEKWINMSDKKKKSMNVKAKCLFDRKYSIQITTKKMIQTLNL